VLGQVDFVNVDDDDDAVAGNKWPKNSDEWLHRNEYTYTKNCAFSWKISGRSWNTSFSRPTQAHLRNISIGSAVFAVPAVVTTPRR